MRMNGKNEELQIESFTKHSLLRTRNFRSSLFVENYVVSFPKPLSISAVRFEESLPHLTSFVKLEIKTIE